MPFYQKGDVRIRYEETGSGFPLLVTPGGGLNSRVSNGQTAVFNAMEAFKNDFRCITMDQRNANGGESTGPVPVDNPWDAFADDQLGLMDHLGIREFFFIRNCQTPMLVLPDDVPGHPLQTSIDVASLAPNAEITVYPWKEPEELKQRTIDRVRRFLRSHIPMRAAAQ